MSAIDLATPAGTLLRESLSQWSALMPDQITRKVVGQILMPKLTQALSVTNVKIDIKDWLSLIGKRNMKQLFNEVVKVQLTPIFSDRKMFKSRALDLFSPWVSCLETKEVVSFANKYVWPKLTSQVKRLEVDPSDQDLKPLYLLFAWSRVLPAPYSLK